MPGDHTHLRQWQQSARLRTAQAIYMVMLKEGGWWSSQELSEHLGQCFHVVADALLELVRLGHVVQRPSGRMHRAAPDWHPTFGVTKACTPLAVKKSKGVL